MNFNYLFNKYIIWAANTPKNKTYAGIVSPSKNNIAANIVATDNGDKYLIKILTKLIESHQFKILNNDYINVFRKLWGKIQNHRIPPVSFILDPSKEFLKGGI
jgi:hypothetical protein